LNKSIASPSKLAREKLRLNARRQKVDFSNNQKCEWKKIKSGPHGPMVMQLA